MSENFPRPNPALEKLVAAAQSPQQIHEILRQHQESNGLPSFDNRYVEVTTDAVSQPSSAHQPQPTATPQPQNCVRVVYPGGNSRFEIYGASEADLDAQEAKIRAMYR